MPQIAVFARLIVTQEHIVLPCLFARVRCGPIQSHISPLVVKFANIAFAADGTRQAHQLTPFGAKARIIILPKSRKAIKNIMAALNVNYAANRSLLHP
jgi:hypothetical protein